MTRTRETVRSSGWLSRLAGLVPCGFGGDASVDVEVPLPEDSRGRHRPAGHSRSRDAVARLLLGRPFGLDGAFQIDDETPGEPLRDERVAIGAPHPNRLQQLGFAPDLRFEGALDAMIDRELVDHITAVVRESLANAARHANATKVSATLSVVDGDNLVITITDDGKGIGDPDHISGLGNMRSRAEQLGGSFTIESPVAPGPGGTRLVWTIPLHAES